MATVQHPSRPRATEARGLRGKLSSLLLAPPDPARRRGDAIGAARTDRQPEEHPRAADDKERLVGLLAAPFGAAIALLVYGALVANDPSAHARSGPAGSTHVPPSLYVDLLGVLLALAIAMLATAWLRKRLLLGCAMALYGLAIFDMHYWGFGVPYVLFGAWLVVRAYRAQRALRETTWGSSTARGGAGAALVTTPAQSKRYTPGPARRRT